MKQSIGSTWIFQLVIIFILLFVSFLVLTLTYSKSYKTKNELLNIIEKNEGINETSLAIMNNYLLETGYGYMHACPSSTGVDGLYWYGADDLSKVKLEPAKAGKKYYYCLRKHKNLCGPSKNKMLKTMFYELQIFFKFNFPVIQSIGTFTTNGTTSEMFISKDYFDINKFGVVNDECNSK